MAFAIPSNDVAFNAQQALWYDTDVAILVAGLQGQGVAFGCAATAQGTPDMTVAIAAGLIRSGGATAAVTAGNGTISAAHATLPRIDLVSASAAGVKTVTPGSAAAQPKPPSLPAGHVALAMVYVPATDVTIAANQITDKRVLLGAVELDRVGFTAPVTISATTEATATTIVTATALTFDGATPIDIEFFADYLTAGASVVQDVAFVLYDGAASIGFMGLMSFPSSASNQREIPALTRRLTPSAAAHTYSVRAYASTGTAIVGAGVGGIGTHPPGFVALRKVA